MRVSWADWVLDRHSAIGLAALTWSAQDSLGAISRLISILASQATLREYSSIEEEVEHDLMEALRD